jgi:hypothetical protein
MGSLSCAFARREALRTVLDVGFVRLLLAPSNLVDPTVNAPKLYKQFSAVPLTIVLWEGQTQPWKVGILVYEHIVNRIRSFRLCTFSTFQPTYFSYVPARVV